MFWDTLVFRHQNEEEKKIRNCLKNMVSGSWQSGFKMSSKNLQNILKCIKNMKLSGWGPNAKISNHFKPTPGGEGAKVEY